MLIEHTGIVLGSFLITYMIRLVQINHYGRTVETFDALEWYQMMERIHGELFPWFAGVAVLLLVLTSLIPYGLLRRMDPVTLLEEGTR